MSSESPAGALLVARLAARAPLSEADRTALLAIPLSVRVYDPSAYIVREGQVPLRCGILLEGFAYRQKLTENGARQIVALLVPGDIFDLQNLHLAESDHNVQALTRVVAAEASVAALRELSIRSSGIGTAMWVDALIEASILREWVLNVGRRDARARLAHLLCEFELRVKAAGMITSAGYELPLTQEQLADALGLTPVHVNRVLKVLQRDGLIDRQRRQIQVTDWPRLRAAAGFSQRYLHLAQTAAQTP